MVASVTRPRSAACRQHLFQHAAQTFALLRGQFDQHVPGMRRCERIAAARGVFQNQLDAAPRHDLEARDVAAAALLRDTEQFERGLRRSNAGKGGLDRARPRHQAQHRRGDDAERAFGADEQVFQVVAGIVLFQLVEIVEHAAVGQHHFETERVRARDAVGQCSRAAGIGGKIAADGAGAFRRQELRIEPVDCGRGFARALQGDAGLAGDGVRGRIDLADAVEPVERQHDLVVVRNLPADQAGIAALRHDRRFRRVGEFEDRRYFARPTPAATPSACGPRTDGAFRRDTAPAATDR